MYICGRSSNICERIKPNIPETDTTGKLMQMFSVFTQMIKQRTNTDLSVTGGRTRHVFICYINAQNSTAPSANDEN